MEKETIMIDGVRYYADRPRSCRGCFFWKNRKVGCTLKKENCYYLIFLSFREGNRSEAMIMHSMNPISDQN